MYFTETPAYYFNNNNYNIIYTTEMALKFFFYGVAFW